MAQNSLRRSPSVPDPGSTPDAPADPRDDEDPDLAFIDDLQAEALPEEPAADAPREAPWSAGPPPVPPQPNPEPDLPTQPEDPQGPADDTDALGRPLPALLRRPH